MAFVLKLGSFNKYSKIEYSKKNHNFENKCPEVN